MKKILVLIIVLSIFITGCTSKKEEKTSYNNKKEINEKQEDNLFEEKSIKTDDQSSQSNDENNDKLVEYIEEVVNETETITKEKDSNQSESKLRNTFITLTDFIFYNGKIKGHTFSELKETEKQRVITAWEKLDSYIETKYPNYKEEIKDTSKKTYSNLKENIKTIKEKILDKLQETIGQEKLNQTIEQYNEDKTNLEEHTEPYKEKAKEVQEKAKETYENTKSKLKEWYENYKNKN